MRDLLLWESLRTLSQDPIYLREKGSWGKPNPFFNKISRFSPFVVIGALFFGICGGVGYPTIIAGDEALAAFWCFLCLPGILLNSVSMFATLMAPALTAPSICMEKKLGTWEILRVTPQSSTRILLAKMLGSLARLRIWRILLVLSILQGFLIAGASMLAGGYAVETGFVAGAATAVRPWVEVLFAGVVGMYFSIRVRSTSTALAASYTAVVLTRIVNSSSMWVGFASIMSIKKQLLVGSVGPPTLYLLTLTGLWADLTKQAEALDYG